MERRDDDKKGKGEFSGSNSKVRCKGGELILLAPPKRGGGPTETATSTPIRPWKCTEGVLVVGDVFSGGGAQQLAPLFLPPSPAPIPARRVAAALWEFLHYFSPPEVMQFGGEGDGDGDGLRLRLHQHHQRRRRDHHQHYLHHRRLQAKGDVGFDDQVNLGGPSHRSPEHQPATASSLRRQVAALLAQHHRASERNHHHHHPQPRSPASYGSSLEISAYNQPSTPSSSIEFKGRIGESGYGFKTSTELLKVLNRIWTLEEQHASNVSLVKALKTELDHARMRIKELHRDQQASRHEIDELMKQVAEDKLSKKSKDQERIHATVESLRGELEDERKLRKRSEGLHRRLAREIFEVKVALSTSFKELERERAGRCLLEELCDEFAKGIIEYEQEAHILRQMPEKNRTDMGIGMTEGDHLIIHMCESWLDERIQMRDQEDTQDSSFVQQGLVVDKIRDEIENFLQARKTVASKENAKHSHLRRNSLESFPLHNAGSAPRYMGNEDSAASTRFVQATQAGNKRFESHEDRIRKDPINTKNEYSEASTAANHQDEIQAVDSETKLAADQEKTVTEISLLQAPPDKHAVPREGKGAMHKLVSELLLSEGGHGSVDADENRHREVAFSDWNPSSRRKATNASPLNKAIASSASPHPERLESTSKNSLKAKLQEPKARVGYRSRLKILKGSS